MLKGVIAGLAAAFLITFSAIIQAEESASAPQTSEDKAMSSSFLAGHGRANTTPDFPVQLAGYKPRTALNTGVHDDLFLNVIALSDDQKTILLVAIDLCLIRADDANALKKEVAAATGVSAANILVNVSHTHAGPSIIVEGDQEKDVGREYFAFILPKAAEAAKQAIDDLSPAKFMAGAAPIHIGGNRRQKDAEGKVKLGVNPEGPRMEECTVWHFVREGKPGIVLFSSANHGTTLGGDNLLLSSEWMGAAVRDIEKARPDVRAVFFQGACGDQNVFAKDHKNFDQVAEIGQQASESVLEALESPQELNPLPINSVARNASLPFDDGTKQTLAVHGIRIGDAVMLGMGGEPFVEYALHIREKSPAKSTIVMGYTDGSIGYLSTKQAMAEGGYETMAWKKVPGARPFDPSMEEALKKELRDLMAETLAEPVAAQ